MVDLSQKQPLKQDPTSDAPANDKPPVVQPDEPSVIPTPREPNKPPDDISTPPIKDEEKIDSPKQEEIKKELSELGIPPAGGTKKTKVLLAALGVFLLIATLPAAVYLVKQRQEVRKEAEECGPCPEIMPPASDFCLDGTITPGGTDECGCQTPPTCQRPSPIPCVRKICRDTKCVTISVTPPPGVEPVCPSNECSIDADCGALCTDLTASPSAELLAAWFGKAVGGDAVLFTCRGVGSANNPINHFEFRVSIDGEEPVELSNVVAITKTDGEYRGSTNYTIPNYGCYKVECRVCSSSDSSECNEWGQAQ